MEYRRLGKTNLKVSRLGLGAMGFGDKAWRGWVLDRDAAKPVISRSLDVGINFFDTCDFYSMGESERMLADLLVSQVPRDSVVIATKAGNPMQKHVNGRGYSRKHIFEAVDASLRRLGTDYIDLYQTHIWDPETDLDELVDVFADVVKMGKVLYVGATTMPAWSFCSSLHIARFRALPAFVSMQCEYNPCHREAEREMLPLCRANGIGLVPFSPMARGFLSADRRAAEASTPRTKTDDYTGKLYYRESDFAVLEAVQSVAKRHEVTPSQVALAWTAGRTGITAPIFGPTAPQHVDAAVEALAIELSDEDVSAIEAAYAPREIHASGH
ncbi:aryl-alcohol dehydrogenase-like predicted oxidoreductase [Rhodoligotrophos appendicifer]|uniref:aldo/keto reductase n=1 Tax=Rhodoligotrophos appendicifer TaxID=987056 RepID=UPI00118514DC|nr:aldo/keto reductase [Rhodoligotrophos appendicifer]